MRSPRVHGCGCVIAHDLFHVCSLRSWFKLHWHILSKHAIPAEITSLRAYNETAKRKACFRIKASYWLESNSFKCFKSRHPIVWNEMTSRKACLKIEGFIFFRLFLIAKNEQPTRHQLSSQGFPGAWNLCICGHQINEIQENCDS